MSSCLPFSITTGRAACRPRSPRRAGGRRICIRRPAPRSLIGSVISATPGASWVADVFTALRGSRHRRVLRLAGPSTATSGSCRPVSAEGVKTIVRAGRAVTCAPAPETKECHPCRSGRSSRITAVVPACTASVPACAPVRAAPWSPPAATRAAPACPRNSGLEPCSPRSTSCIVPEISPSRCDGAAGSAAGRSSCIISTPPTRRSPVPGGRASVSSFPRASAIRWSGMR